MQVIGPSVCVQQVVWMHFRLAEVAPPTVYTADGVAFVDIPEPLLRFGPEDVEQTGTAEIEVVHIRFAVGVFAEQAFLHRFIVCFGIFEDEGFGDKYGFNTLFFQVGHHGFGLRKGVAQPLKIAEMPFDVGAKPKQVEHHRIQRNVVSPVSGHGVFHLCLGVVAHSGGDVAQGPSGWQGLSAREVGVLLHKVGPGVGRHHEVTHSAAHGFHLQDVGARGTKVEVAGRAVVEHHHVLVGRHDHRQGIIHQIGLGFVSIAGFVVQP